MKRILLAAVVLAMAAGVADAKSCKDPVTKKFAKCPTAAASSAPAMGGMSSMASSSTKKPPHCVKGKLCGNTCIKSTDVCHK